MVKELKAILWEALGKISKHKYIHSFHISHADLLGYTEKNDQQKLAKAGLLDGLFGILWSRR